MGSPIGSCSSLPTPFLTLDMCQLKSSFRSQETHDGMEDLWWGKEVNATFLLKSSILSSWIHHMWGGMDEIGFSQKYFKQIIVCRQFSSLKGLLCRISQKDVSGCGEEDRSDCAQRNCWEHITLERTLRDFRTNISCESERERESLRSSWCWTFSRRVYTQMHTISPSSPPPSITEMLMVPCCIYQLSHSKGAEGKSCGSTCWTLGWNWTACLLVCGFCRGGWVSLPGLVGTLLICIHNIALFMHHLLQSPYGFCSFTWSMYSVKCSYLPLLQRLRRHRALQSEIDHGRRRGWETASSPCSYIDKYRQKQGSTLGPVL